MQGTASFVRESRLTMLSLCRMSKWAKQYGGIFSLKRFRNTTIVLTDWKIMKELVDKKSTNFSHRPPSKVADLITRGNHILMMQYGETWRTMRKLIHQYLMESQCEKEHWKVQEAEAAQMLHDFLVDPENHMKHPKRYSNSITMSLGTLRSSLFLAPRHLQLLSWICSLRNPRQERQ